MKHSEVIDAMSREIQERGWCKNTLVNHAGQVCLQGSLLAALGFTLTVNASGQPIMFDLRPGRSDTDPWEIYAEVDLYLRARILEEYPEMRGVPEFNDRSNTTKEDILLFLEKARIGLEEKGE